MLSTALQKTLPAWDDEWQQMLQQVVMAANEQVYAYASTHQLSGMGTTLTLLLITRARAHFAHVGDSRAYLFNVEGVTDEHAPVMQITSDHSLVARLVDIGQITPEQARIHPQRNMLYRALGTQSTVDVDAGSLPLGVGDTLLLCSDGLTTHLDEGDLTRIVLADQASKPINQMCEHLIAEANQCGGRDNISVVLATVEGIQHHVNM
jgi:protein phosphatase